MQVICAPAQSPWSLLFPSPALVTTAGGQSMITARIKLKAPRETVVLVADTRQAVDNIIEALREDGVYADHSFIGGGLDGDELVRCGRGAR